MKIEGRQQKKLQSDFKIVMYIFGTQTVIVI